MRRLLIASALAHVLISAFTVIPTTVKVITSGGGPFGFALMVLPVTLPLSLSALFGPVAIFTTWMDFKSSKKIFILICLLISLSAILLFFFIPTLPFFLVLMPATVLPLVSLSKENMVKRLILLNTLLIICTLATAFYFGLF